MTENQHKEHGKLYNLIWETNHYYSLPDDRMLTGFGFATVLIGGLIVLIAVIVVAIGTISYHVDHTDCFKWGKANQREVQWVKYGLWHGECVTPSADGHMITIDKVLEVSR